jgi:hypothetical protein
MSFDPHGQPFTVVHGRGVHQFSATPTQWTPSNTDWNPPGNLQSENPADAGFKDVSGDLDASHVNSIDDETPSIHHDEGPFSRAHDGCEYAGGEECADDDLSDNDFSDLDGDDSPQDGDKDRIDDDVDASKITEPDDDATNICSRGVAYVPNLAQARPARIVPFRAQAGPVSFAAQPGPVTFTR